MADTCTKWILGIIAAALVALVIENAISRATAQVGFARVQICDAQNCAALVPTQQSVAGRTVVVWSIPVSPRQ